MKRLHGGHGRDGHADFAGYDCLRCRRRALVRNVQHVGAHLMVERLEIQLRHAADAEARVVDRARLGLRERDEILHVFTPSFGFATSTYGPSVATPM